MTFLTNTNYYIASFLALNIVFSSNAMWGLLYRNGYYDAMIRLRDYGPHFLPGSKTPILTTYTCIGPLDKLATFSVIFFTNVTDGSAPQESLFAFHFGGQLASIFTIIMIEAIRSGNRRSSFALPAIWGLGMQIMGYGCVMPLYAMCHLLTSSTASTNDLEVSKQAQIWDLAALRNLLPSMAIGFVLPTVLMAIPFRSSNLHQWFSGFWQGFPIWVPLVQSLLGLRQRRSVSSQLHNAQPKTPKSTQDETMESAVKMNYLRRAYAFAFGAAAVTHIATFAILAMRKAYPALFSTFLQQTLTFHDVFVPPPFYSSAVVNNLAVAILNFFQYNQYGGSVGAVVWALTLYCRTRHGPTTSAGWSWLFVNVLSVGVIAGPSGIYTWLLWRRDEVALGKSSTDELHKE